MSAMIGTASWATRLVLSNITSLAVYPGDNFNTLVGEDPISYVRM